MSLTFSLSLSLSRENAGCGMNKTKGKETPLLGMFCSSLCVSSRLFSLSLSMPLACVARQSGCTCSEDLLSLSLLLLLRKLFCFSEAFQFREEKRVSIEESAKSTFHFIFSFSLSEISFSSLLSLPLLLIFDVMCVSRVEIAV